MKVILEDFYKSRPIRVYIEYAPTIRSERGGLMVLYEKCIYSKISENRICEKNQKGL